MSRVFSKVVNPFRLSANVSKSGNSMSPLSMLPALGQSQLTSKPFGGGLGECGCIGGFARFGTSSRCNSESASTSTSKKIEDKPTTEASSAEPKSGQVFRHARHNMFVCWHPEVPFPYEMTKPIDLTAPVSNSHLKIQMLPPVKEAFRQKHYQLTVKELVKLTYSTKHRFYGRFGKSKRLVLRDMDPNKERRNREYL